MTRYVVGQPYRSIVALKNGSPVYQMTTVKGFEIGRMILANGRTVEVCITSDGGPKLDKLPDRAA